MHEDVRDRLNTAFDDGGTQALKNIARPVQVWRWQPATAVPSKPAPAPTVLPLPDKPSIAVLPFQNMSGDPEQEYFADGVAEDIVLRRYRAPSRCSSSPAIRPSPTKASRQTSGRSGANSACAMCSKAVSAKLAIAVRITGQLIDAASGSHVWADRFESDLGDIFELQDHVTSSVVGAIAPSLELAVDQPDQDKRYGKSCLPTITTYGAWRLSIGLLERTMKKRYAYFRKLSSLILNSP